MDRRRAKKWALIGLASAASLVHQSNYALSIEAERRSGVLRPRGSVCAGCTGAAVASPGQLGVWGMTRYASTSGSP